MTRQIEEIERQRHNLEALIKEKVLLSLSFGFPVFYFKKYKKYLFGKSFKIFYRFTCNSNSLSSFTRRNSTLTGLLRY